MKNQDTLSSIQSDFALWRQNKTSPRDRTPDDLKRRTVALLNNHSPGKITNSLGISREMLKRWQNEIDITSGSDAIEFVSLPSETIQVPSGDSQLLTKLSFTQPNGNHWSLQGELSPSQLTAFVRALTTV